MMDGIFSPCTISWNCSVICPFLVISYLDFLGLNAILAHATVSSNAVSIHLAWIWVSVVIVRSSMKPLFGGCLMLLDVFGPLVSLSPALMIIFIPITNRITEMVHPVTIPFCSGCHVVVNLLVVNRKFIVIFGTVFPAGCVFIC